MPFTQLFVARIEDGIGRLGQSNIGGIVSGEVVTELRDAVNQRRVSATTRPWCGRGDARLYWPWGRSSIALAWTAHTRSTTILCMSRVLFLAVLLMATVAQAQMVDEFNNPKTPCCIPAAVQRLADQLADWNQLGRYYAANEELKRQPADARRVVFLGDSITDGWHLDQFFPGKPYVNRGISGQTTPQMLVRMFPDVIDLKPAAMIILAGTNDIARNTGPETPTIIEENFQAITELAQAHGVKVILCSILPIADYGPVKMSPGRPPADIVKLNSWLKTYAAKVNAIYADYFSAVADDKGFLKPGISRDGLHPNEDGYKLMAPVAEAAIAKALQ